MGAAIVTRSLASIANGLTAFLFVLPQSISFLAGEAYRSRKYRERELSKDHVVPISKRGRDNWVNVVTACRPCNHRKANRTPEQARMELLYVPYTPNRHEHFILQNRNILADQMEYLMASVPRHSRLHS